MVLYGVSFLLFILLNIMVRNSPVCSRKKKKNLPSKVFHELQLTDFSLSGNPNLQEVSCVLG